MEGVTEERAREIARAAFQELIATGLAKGDLVKVSDDNGVTYVERAALKPGGRLSDGTIQSVREVTSMVEVALEHGIALHPSGAAHVLKGRCPASPWDELAFLVNGKKNVFFCNACGQGGDAITFVMDVDELSFVEAVEKLAERSDLDLRYLPV